MEFSPRCFPQEIAEPRFNATANSYLNETIDKARIKRNVADFNVGN